MRQLAGRLRWPKPHESDDHGYAKPGFKHVTQISTDGFAGYPEAVDLAETFGIDLAGHRARDLAQLNLESFDLVLGFERMHVRAAVVDGFAPIERTFTLPELVELLESIPEPSSRHDPVEQARNRIAQAHGLRSPDFRSSAVAEIADPLGRTAREQRRTAHELQELVGRLALALFA